MKKILGDEYYDFENALLNGSASQAFYVNTKDALSLPQSFLESVNANITPFCDIGYYFNAEKIGKSPLHHAGAFYVQDPSAMCSLSAASIPAGSKILDLCASPGGKTLYAAIKTGADGFVVANEYNVTRCKTLVGNVERLGLSNVSVINFDATDKTQLCDIYKGYFDVIIADCPCSGEGMFRKYPEQAIGEWNEENIELCSLRQSKILETAKELLSPGGLIIYSTCTFSLQENEMLICKFLSQNQNFKLEDTNKQVKDVTCDGYCFDGCDLRDIYKARRFYPHKSRGEGQFIALLRNTDDIQTAPDSHKEARAGIKREKNDARLQPSLPSKEELSAVISFFDSVGIKIDTRCITKYADNLIFTKSPIKLPTRHVFSGGVKLGEVSKGRLIPHHQLFKVFGKSFTRKVELTYNDPDAEKYLCGQTLCCDIPDGWCAVIIDGFVAGGAKASGGVVKNHYPKGLRQI